MTLSETIEYYEQEAKMQELLDNICEPNPFEFEKGLKKIENYRQIANWLKELKAIREYIGPEYFEIIDNLYKNSDLLNGDKE